MASGNIGLIADDLGISNLAVSAIDCLQKEVEYKLRELVETADKFKRRARRNKLTSSDLLKALKVFRVETLYGFPSDTPARYRSVNEEIWVQDEEVVELTKVLIDAPAIIPAEPDLHISWLAIDGKRPNIPENQVYTTPGEPELPSEDTDDSTHDLSSEQQAFYDRFLVCISTGKGMEQMLVSMREDSSLASILPYNCGSLFGHMNDGGDLEVLGRVVSLVEALVHNMFADLEPYLHQLLQGLITVLMHETYEDERQWEFRDRTSRVIVALLTAFDTSYPDLKTRVVELLINVLLDETRQLEAHFGAISTVNNLGPGAYEKILIPIIDGYTARLSATVEGEMCRKALIDGGRALVAARPEFQQQLREVFGDQVIVEGYDLN